MSDTGNIMAGNKSIENWRKQEIVAGTEQLKAVREAQIVAGKNWNLCRKRHNIFTFRFFLALASATFFTDLALISFILAL